MLNLFAQMGNETSNHINTIQDKQSLIKEYKLIDRQLEKNDQTSYKVLISFFIAIILFILFSIYTIADIYTMDIISSDVEHMSLNAQTPLFLDIVLYGSVFVLIVFIALALKDMQKRSVLINRKIELLELLKDVPFFEDEYYGEKYD